MIKRQRLLPFYTYRVYWFVALYAYLISSGFAYYNYNHLPESKMRLFCAVVDYKRNFFDTEEELIDFIAILNSLRADLYFFWLIKVTPLELCINALFSTFILEV